MGSVGLGDDRSCNITRIWIYCIQDEDGCEFELQGINCKYIASLKRSLLYERSLMHINLVNSMLQTGH